MAASDQTGLGSHALYQDVFIPANAASADLYWTHRIVNPAGAFYPPVPATAPFPVEPVQTPTQYFSVQVWDTANNLLFDLYMTQPGDNPSEASCTTHTASLLGFAGQTVRIVFIEEDDQLFFNALVDDVSVRVCGAADCNGNGVLNERDITSAADCNQNGVPDECELTSVTDCNDNGILDECELTTEADCNDNGVLDECELSTETDCNDNAILDQLRDHDRDRLQRQRHPRRVRADDLRPTATTTRYSIAARSRPRRRSTATTTAFSTSAS